MKKLLSILLLLVALSLQGFAADESVIVPEGVTYIRAEPALNAKARILIETAIATQPYQLASLFEPPFVCGPELWTALKAHTALKGMEISPAEIKIPLADGSFQSLEGALIQEQSEVTAFCTALKDFLKTSDVYTVRCPSAKELQHYWAMIPYDITEPIFVAASNNAALLIHFNDEMKALWIDDLNGVDTAR